MFSNGKTGCLLALRNALLLAALLLFSTVPSGAAESLGLTAQEKVLRDLTDQEEIDDTEPSRVRMLKMLAQGSGRIVNECSTLAGLYEKGTRGLTPDLQKAFGWYLRAAELEHRGSIAWLSKAYAEGWGVAADAERSRVWLFRAADQGDTRSRVKAAEFLLSQDHPSENDVERATRWYVAAAKYKNYDAVRALGLTRRNLVPPKISLGYLSSLADDGDHLAIQRYAEAIELAYGPIDYLDLKEDPMRWWIKAAEAGSPEAYVVAARLYEAGGPHRGDKPDYKMALVYYQKDSEAGSSESSLRLSQIYGRGEFENRFENFKRGVERNSGEATRWLKKAAEAGLPDAMARIGTLQILDGDLPIDFEKGEAAWREAAAKGSAEAMLRIGSYYLVASNPRRNVDQAVNWLTRAAENDYKKYQLFTYGGHGSGLTVWRNLVNPACRRARHKLGVLYFDGDDVPQDIPQAVEWWSKASEAESAESMYLLGRLVLDGDVAGASAAECVALWTRAAGLGATDAAVDLSYLYFKGEQSIKKDIKQAASWAEVAARLGDRSMREMIGEYKVAQNDRGWWGNLARDAEAGLRRTEELRQAQAAIHVRQGRCPVCRGMGRVQRTTEIGNLAGTYARTFEQQVDCLRCDGSGRYTAR